jgi:phosphate-transporting ATPase
MPAEEEPLFACRGLTRAPWHVGRDLAIGPGEVLVLRGPTGSGKTLLMRALADLDPFETGEVSVEGTRREELDGPGWRSLVHYVSPNAPRLDGTVAAHVERVREVGCRGGASCAAVELPPGIEPGAPTRQLSSGQGQMLALTLSLARRPRVLLLDEVTSHLDPDSGAVWEQRIVEFVRDGRAALWASHDPGLAGRIGAREVHL